MSMLIMGVNPPKSCYVCSWYNKVQCPVNDGRYYYRAERHPSCPLVEIPSPHGRLIDKDKLRHELFVNFNGERIPFYDYDNFPTKIAYIDLHSILAEQKTVIEEEGSEK